MRRKSDQLTEQENQELEDLYMSTYSEAYEEAYEKPLKYLHHDTDAHQDDELRVIAAESGSLEVYGQYWCLMELLAARKGHYCDVSDERGWTFLSLDMSTCGVSIEVETCKELVRKLVKYNKLDRESFEESCHIVCDRICRQAGRYAEEYATSKAAGAKSARKRQMLSEKET